MSALRTIFEAWQEGTEYSLEEKEDWALLNLNRGDCVEIPMSFTNWEPPSQARAGFVVMDRMVTSEGGMALRAHGIGCSDPQLNKRISSFFNRKEGFLHLCISSPCTEAEENFLHVTRLKAFSREGFNPPYFLGSHRRQVAKWLDGEEIPGEEREEIVGEGGAGPSRDRSVLPDLSWLGSNMEDKKVVAEKGGREKARSRPAPKSRETRPGALRPSHAASRARAKGKGVAEGLTWLGGDEIPGGTSRKDLTGPEEEDGEPAGVDIGTSREREQMSTAELRKKLDAVRDRLGGAVRPTVRDLRRLEEEEGAEDQSPDRELSSGYAEESRGLTSGTSLRKRKQLEDSRGSSSKDVSSQLVRQAQHSAAGRLRKSGDEKEKEKEGAPPQRTEREELLALLNQVGKRVQKKKDGDKDPPKKDKERSRSEKKKKKKEKKKGKKRRLVNGVLVSSSGSDSSDEESSGDSGSDSESQFEAPLRKRSKASPGAVLRLLVQKAQAALDQGALVEVSRGGGSAITEGVKLTTYFQLHVKPQFSHMKGPMRDLSLMAASLDAFRAGSIGRGCDLLAGHFLAAHQALMDASWSQAKYLEVHEGEEQHATSAAILLEARKHAKTSLKAETPEAWMPSRGWQRSWYPASKGPWQQDKGKGRGKKGGKGKDKGSWSDREGKGKNKWKETHDKGDKEEK